MSDDLVKREWGRTLRNGLTDLEKMLGDRVEALTAELAEHADVRKQIDYRLAELVAQVDALTAERYDYKRSAEILAEQAAARPQHRKGNQMSDDDMIRRGDVLRVVYDALTYSSGQAVQRRIRALPAVQPGVKPLVWTAFSKECLRAESIFGIYELMWGFKNGQAFLSSPHLCRIDTWHPDIEFAKAYAVTDYEARILSALEPQPVPDLPSPIDDTLSDFALQAATRGYVACRYCEPCGRKVATEGGA